MYGHRAYISQVYVSDRLPCSLWLLKERSFRVHAEESTKKRGRETLQIHRDEGQVLTMSASVCEGYVAFSGHFPASSPRVSKRLVARVYCDRITKPL